MTATGLDVFDTTVQKTNLWLQEIMDELGWPDRQMAYLGLRATLHALRDRLTPDEAAQLAAQLPMLVRGIYFEGWDPSHKPERVRDRQAFLDMVAREFERTRPIDPERVSRAVFRVLSRQVDSGEIQHVQQSLPSDIRALWS